METWLQDETANTDFELANGDGCHPSEVDALRRLLNEELSAQDAAKEMICLPTDQGIDLPNSVYPARLWGLLGDALVHHGQAVGQVALDLLEAIQLLPPTTTPARTIDWSDLPDFGHMWHDLHGSGWGGAMTEEREISMREMYEDIGMAEARMWLRVPNALSPDQGYKALEFSITGGPAGFGFSLHLIRGWLKVAATELKARMSVSTTMDRWSVCERALSDLSGSTPPAEYKVVAEDCLGLMAQA